MKKSKEFETIFSEETSLHGDLKYDTSLQINGHFEGKINTKGTLLVSKGAKVTATIKAKILIISGFVKGDCYVSEKLEMTQSGKLKGNIQTKKLKLADGVLFEGKCEMIK